MEQWRRPSDLSRAFASRALLLLRAEGGMERGRKGGMGVPSPPSFSPSPFAPDRNRNVAAATATKSILVVNSRVTPKGRRRRRRRLGRRRRRNRSLQLMTERLRRQLRGEAAANDEEEPF